MLLEAWLKSIKWHWKVFVFWDFEHQRCLQSSEITRSKINKFKKQIKTWNEKIKFDFDFENSNKKRNKKCLRLTRSAAWQSDVGWNKNKKKLKN